MPKISKPMQEAQRAFAAGPPPYVSAAILLSVIAARAYAAGIGTRKPLKLRTELAKEQFYERAKDAAIAACSQDGGTVHGVQVRGWQPRDRRAGFDKFKTHVLKEVDRVLARPTAPQGIATGSHRADGLTVIEGAEAPIVDTRDKKGFVVPGGNSTDLHTVDAATLEAFERKYPEEHKLATAVIPYTDVTPARYAQQRRQKSRGCTDADRADYEQRIRNAVDMLRMFVKLRVPASGLDFQGEAPTPAHQLLWLLKQGVPLQLPGRPPLADELLNPFGQLDPRTISQRAREYFSKLLVYFTPVGLEAIADAAREEAQTRRQANSRQAKETLVETLKAHREDRRARDQTDIGRVLLSIDERKEKIKKTGLKRLKGKRSTRKP